MKSGMVFLLLGVLASSASIASACLDPIGFWGSPRDWYNLIGGIALSVVGASLLGLNRTMISNPFRSFALDSIGVFGLDRIRRRLAFSEQIMSKKAESDFIAETAIVTGTDSTDSETDPLPALRMAVNEPIDTLMESASSLLTNEQLTKA